MQFIINIQKKHFYILVGLISVLSVLLIANGAYVGHSWSDVTGGSPVLSSLKVTGEFDADGDVNFTDANIIGLSMGSTPAGFIGAFNLTDCPSGWIHANGSAGTPDLRGMFIRGLDDGSVGNDPDAPRTLGSIQFDELGSHSHAISAVHNTGSTHRGGSASSYNWRHEGFTTGNTGGGETRPKNVALIYCMKIE
jgi:hypothetical protein